MFTGSSDREVYEQMDAMKAEVEAVGGTEVRRTKIGRNTPCPCASGRKFKKCCGG
ncbi:MAG: SEC-C metal-binding domain-containing protein [Solirubrobacterales bacterium]